jgi:hypothetical protein
MVIDADACDPACLPTRLDTKKYSYNSKYGNCLDVLLYTFSLIDLLRSAITGDGRDRDASIESDASAHSLTHSLSLKNALLPAIIRIVIVYRLSLSPLTCCSKLS